MTDFEPIVTDEEYETVQEIIVNIEARLLEMEQALADKTAPHLEAIEVEKEKHYRVINNLKASLYRHKAASHDYWLNSGIDPEDCAKCHGLGAPTDEWVNDPSGWADPCADCKGSGMSNKYSGSWQAEVTSISDLISAAATDPQWEEYLLPNQTKLNARARKDKRAMFAPGTVPVRKEK